MDPDATFESMIEAFNAGELDLAADYAQALIEWLRRGGFPPGTSVVASGVVLQLTNEQTNRAIAYAVANEIFAYSLAGGTR